jgi:hypothetical protein
MVRFIGLLLLAVSATLAVPSQASADYFDDIGYTALAAELGIAIPTGSGVNLSQIEALSAGEYFPNPDHLELIGKTFSDRSGQTSTFSHHANDVGRFLMGNTSGVAPGIDQVDVYEAIDWYGRVLLRSDNNFTGEPLVETNRLQNHSWIANRQADTSPVTAAKIVRLLDYTITRDNVVSIVSVSNDSTAGIPDLLSHTYNGITVGTTLGSHSSGGTTFDGLGRVKPDIVAPFASTSFSVPTVSGCAGMLLEVIDDTPAFEDAAAPEAIKAILMAGATKQEIPGWSRSPTSPLDATSGAGEVNIQNSYHILNAGKQNTINDTEVSTIGWDTSSISTGETNHYFFSAPEGFQLNELSAMLVWNRVITDNDPTEVFDPSAYLPDHDLTLFATRNFLLNSQIDSSHNTANNLEHIYVQQLGIGQFVLSVTSDTGGDYALAWRTTSEIRPRITQLQVRSPTNTQITAAVASGNRYKLESTENLNAWSTVTEQPSSSNTLVLNDTRTVSSKRAYRINPAN